VGEVLVQLRADCTTPSVLRAMRNPILVESDVRAAVAKVAGARLTHMQVGLHGVEASLRLIKSTFTSRYILSTTDLLSSCRLPFVDVLGGFFKKNWGVFHSAVFCFMAGGSITDTGFAFYTFISTPLAHRLLRQLCKAKEILSQVKTQVEAISDVHSADVHLELID
jgi:hypothetical protein